MSAGRGRARAERLGETGRMDGTGGGGLGAGWRRLHATAGWTHGPLAPGGGGGGGGQRAGGEGRREPYYGAQISAAAKPLRMSAGEIRRWGGAYSGSSSSARRSAVVVSYCKPSSNCTASCLRPAEPRTFACITVAVQPNGYGLRPLMELRARGGRKEGGGEGGRRADRGEGGGRVSVREYRRGGREEGKDRGRRRRELRRE